MTMVFSLPLLPTFDVLPVYIGEWLLAFGLTTLVAALPWFAAQRVADQLGGFARPFLVATAVFTAVGADFLASLCAWSSLSDGDPERIAYAEAFWRFLPTLVAGGLTGGIAYALASERHTRA
jgi:hypothetical protein